MNEVDFQKLLYVVASFCAMNSVGILIWLCISINNLNIKVDEIAQKLEARSSVVDRHEEQIHQHDVRIKILEKRVN